VTAYAHIQRSESEDLEGYADPWPPHDTEESVLGTELHQTTIRNLASSINEAASLAALEGGGPIPWRALSQTAILGCRRPDGSLLLP
jgi:hypothetical protein